MKILCIGEALIDMICTDTGCSLESGEHFLKKAGGAPTNVAAAIGALGGKVSIVAKVGDDAFGRHLMKTMGEFKVSTEWMLVDNDAFTTLAFVSLMPNGERDFVFNRGADGKLSVTDIKDLKVEEFDIVHFGSATAFLEGELNDCYLFLLHRAIALGKFVSFDPNYRHLLFPNDTESFVSQSWYFLERCDFFKVSEEEALLISGKESVEEAAKVLMDRTTAVFAITLGMKGTLLVSNKKTFNVSTIPVRSIDSTGAGDAFAGAVLYQLSLSSLSMIKSLTDDECKKIIYNANKAGARTCEYLGAMEAFKHLNAGIFNG